MSVEVTADVAPGVIAVPHGWGHAGGWQRANAAGGANSNELTCKNPDDFEPVAGMSVLNGNPVRLESAALTSSPSLAEGAAG